MAFYPFRQESIASEKAYIYFADLTRNQFRDETDLIKQLCDRGALDCLKAAIGNLRINVGAEHRESAAEGGVIPPRRGGYNSYIKGLGGNMDTISVNLNRELATKARTIFGHYGIDIETALNGYLMQVISDAKPEYVYIRPPFQFGLCS